MTDIEQLQRRARRAYELGRLQAAGRVVAVILPLTATALLAGVDALLCCSLSLALLAVTVGLRWWSRDSAAAVRSGLMMGVVPLVGALIISRMEGQLGPRSAAYCGAACALIGVAAAAVIAVVRFKVGGADRASHWVQATAVAALTAALGCVALGIEGLLAALAALVAGALVAAAASRRLVT